MEYRIALSALQQRDYLTGTGRHIAELFRALPARAPQFEFLLYIKPDQREAFRAPDEPNGIQRIIHDCPSTPLKRVYWEQANMTTILRRDGVSLYHGPANFLPPRKVCPYVLTLHDMVYFHNPERTFYLRAKYWQYFIRMTWRLADVIITVSEFSKQEIMRYLPVPAERIRVIPNGVDSRFFENAPPEPRESVRKRIGVDSSYILYVGRLDPDKNVGRIVRAFDQLVRGGNRELKLVIAGAKDHQSSRVFEMVEHLRLGDRVVFAGYVPDEELVALYQEAEVFCFPSLNEGFGLPVLEAMAAGVPVVTSNLSSLPEVAGDAGVLVDPYSPREIARGLKSVIGTQRGRELGQAARERARTFTWKRAADETLECYTDVLRKAERRRRSAPT